MTAHAANIRVSVLDALREVAGQNYWIGQRIARVADDITTSIHAERDFPVRAEDLAFLKQIVDAMTFNAELAGYGIVAERQAPDAVIRDRDGDRLLLTGEVA